jgi:ethanolaminephosphotransferase
MARSTTMSLTIPLVTIALIFKVNCEQDCTHTVALPFAVDRTYLFRTLLILNAPATLVVLLICILVVKRNSSADTRLTARHFTLSERLRNLVTLSLITHSRAKNKPIFLVLKNQRMLLQTLLQHKTLAQPDPTSTDATISILAFFHTFFFTSGGSNSISSIDISNAYSRTSSYNVTIVGVLLFSAN